jgi:hypothetical protein
MPLFFQIVVAVVAEDAADGSGFIWCDRISYFEAVAAAYRAAFFAAAVKPDLETGAADSARRRGGTLTSSHTTSPTLHLESLFVACFIYRFIFDGNPV